MASFFRDLNRPLGTACSASADVWPSLADYLDDKMRFSSTPSGTSILAGGLLLSARHKPIRFAADLLQVIAGGEGIWIHGSHMDSKRRKLFAEFFHLMRFL